MHIAIVKIMSDSVLQILFLLVSLTAQASGAAPKLAKAKCAKRCGNVTIPSPFGLGAGCFLDDWYEIICQQNNTVPILNKIGLRVLNISLPSYNKSRNGMIAVSVPAIYSNASCGGDRVGMPVSLEGSPFVFFGMWNVFASVGCNTLAILNSTESAVVGCRSKCSGTNISQYSTCSGRDGCCLTSLPSNLLGFNVDFQEEGDHQACLYAFLADRSWFFMSNFTGLYDLRLNNPFPVVLEWGIANNTNYALQLMRQDYDTVEVIVVVVPHRL